MTVGVWILGDRLSLKQAALQSCKQKDGLPVIFIESLNHWDFLHRHRPKLQTQGRMSFILKNLDKMSVEELQTIQNQAENWHFSATKT